MAGTRNAATGRSRSTAASQRSGSKRGRNHPLSPPRRGPQTRREPLVVANGEEVRNPSPSQAAGRRSMVESPPCRTTTPFGSPVVPEVYMTSATSSGERGRSTSVSSGERSSSHSAPVLTTVGTTDLSSSCTSLHSATAACACCRIRASSAGPSLLRSGTATPQALWIAMYDTSHSRGSSPPIRRPTLSPRRSPCATRPRASRLDRWCHPWRVISEPSARLRHATPSGNARASWASTCVWSNVARRAISRVRPPRGWRAGCPPAFSRGQRR